jgi:regulatory protein
MTFNSRKPKKPPAPLAEDALYTYALNALGRSMKTVAELKRMMRRRVEPGEDGEAKINRVVARLKEYQFLNDTRYATEYTRLRQTNQKFGKRRVQAELIQRGVHGDVIAATVNPAYEDVSEVELAFQHLHRKRVKPPRDQKETARLAGRLARAGFSSGAIFKALRRLKADEAAVEALEAAEPTPDDADRDGDE